MTLLLKQALVRRPLFLTARDTHTFLLDLYITTYKQRHVTFSNLICQHRPAADIDGYIVLKYRSYNSN